MLVAVAVLCLAAPARADIISFTTVGPISIPTSGPATPYPVPIVVSGVTGTVTDFSLTLTNFSHTFPDDVGMILVATDGTSGLVIFDAGTSTAASNVTLTFQDGAPQWPGSGTLTSGTYSPFAYFTGDNFPPPAPAIPGVNPTVAGAYSFAAAFGALADVNGTWNLYAIDFAGDDSGSIESVTLTFTGDFGPAVVPAPPAVVGLLAGLIGLGVRRRLRRS